MKPILIFIVGPTAVGKSQVALALAKNLGAEIISCDSMQVYRGMDIVSDKPHPQAREEIPHHLIDIIPPDKEFSVADYCDLALRAIKKIISHKRLPLLLGGSGLYMKALLDGIFSGGAKDEDIRNSLYQEAEESGSQGLWLRLKKIDPDSARRIHPQDLRRIVRALEVYLKTKTPISQMQKNAKGFLDDYRVYIFGLNRERSLLYQRIEQRVDEMFKQGLVDEVKGLLNNDALGLTASQVIGIKEVKGYLQGRYNLEEAKMLLKKNTRRYAKRQLTWFRRDKRIQWIEIGEDEKAEGVANRILEWKERF